jgi:hypothetical protein
MRLDTEEQLAYWIASKPQILHATGIYFRWQASILNTVCPHMFDANFCGLRYDIGRRWEYVNDVSLIRLTQFSYEPPMHAANPVYTEYSLA